MMLTQLVKTLAQLSTLPGLVSVCMPVAWHLLLPEVAFRQHIVTMSLQAARLHNIEA